MPARLKRWLWGALAWLGLTEFMREFTKTALYEWTLSEASDLVSDRKAAMIAFAATYAVPLTASAAILAAFGFYQYRSGHRSAILLRNASIVSDQMKESERDKHSRITKWLTIVCSDRKMKISRAILFGSVVHDHYPTSDVDLVILLNSRSHRTIARLVKRMKGEIASNFFNTFGHRLHVTFFCQHEQTEMDKFISDVGQHERLN